MSNWTLLSADPSQTEIIILMKLPHETTRTQVS